MIRIKHRDLQEIIDWHYQGFRSNFLFILKKKRNRLKRRNDKKFLAYLIKNLDLIFRGSPRDLERLVEVTELRFRPRYYTTKEWKNRKQDSPTALLNLLNKIFDYKKFSENRNDDWNAYRLAEKLSIPTCPYCNRQYTHTIIDDTKSREDDRRVVRPDFDHFFDKATYPFLALSFYNLVPSCSICNSRLKGSKRFSTESHIHPYLEGFGEFARFCLSVRSSKFFHGDMDSGKIRFQFKEPLDVEEETTLKKVKNNIRVFELDRLYQEHKDYVYELVGKKMIYTEEYLDLLFKKYEGTLFSSREELLRIVHGNYFDEELFINRPLSKLAKDIEWQFDSI